MTKKEALIILELLKKYKVNIDDFYDAFIKRDFAYKSALRYINMGMTEDEFNLIKAWLMN